MKTTGLKLIGKGAFTRCYRLDESTVLLKSRDPIKECMAHGMFPKSPVFPIVECGDECGEYRMKYYPRGGSLKNTLDPDQWEIYKTLRALFDSIGYVKNPHDRYSKLYTLFQELPDNIRDDMTYALDAVANYGSDIGFEISPRNVATDNGKLVLLDCFFLVSELKK
ncbi:hypothetical protein D3C85_1138020 [compost metagenome]